MTLAVRTFEYTLRTAIVNDWGFSWSADELDTALAGQTEQSIGDIIMQSHPFAAIRDALSQILLGEIRIKDTGFLRKAFL